VKISGATTDIHKVRLTAEDTLARFDLGANGTVQTDLGLRVPDTSGRPSG
jgi:hypothetical protein